MLLCCSLFVALLSCSKYSKNIDPRHEKIIGHWKWVDGPGPYLCEIKDVEINSYTLMFEDNFRIKTCSVLSEDSSGTDLEFVNKKRG